LILIRDQRHAASATSDVEEGVGNVALVGGGDQSYYEKKLESNSPNDFVS